MQLLLIRHCASSGQAPEAPLSEVGAQQSLKLADALAPHGVDAIYSSPFARAVATVQPLADRLNLPVTADPRLRERLLSPMDVADWLDHLRRSFDDFTYRVVGGENLHEAQARGLAALADIAARDHRLPAIASHGNLIAAILAYADKTFGFESWRTLRNPDIFKLTLEDGAPVRFERLEPG